MTAERIVCLVAAAGRGKRFGREVPKSFHPVGGKTLLALSIERLSAWKGISEYVVMVPSGWEKKAEEELARVVPHLETRVLAGGETRSESVSIGLEEIRKADLVIVHDACRPVVSAALIGRVVAAARETGAAVPALQATETLGRLRDDSIEATVPRDRVIGIQTPQVFRFEVLEAAFQAADETIRTATDESSLVLGAGFPVRVVEGERWNIKVTVKEDLQILESFLGGGKLELPDEPEG
ncbi:MAG TPA: 2-C-methyl-D-erythritol 4-phosphate cytidylyltransferase [Candidatus Eisenbacteria bacterium]|uniref:2-C-methyl-D-erythritol 4-phosphate cytidylyltransferase n=1 Tax=Eiseniibacteriota bacterium TaxID=2212470 RepID=A0A7V2AVC0_UNCEI|nr:2-C-methyl-D-erythritol 4-phosphate cytidylyltransferase [Candidatus Eisenbacteria bacterium]